MTMSDLKPEEAMQDFAHLVDEWSKGRLSAEVAVERARRVLRLTGRVTPAAPDRKEDDR
jgi:hypothetical protein